jgi:hypothetical protein
VFGGVGSSCSTSGTRHVNLVTKTVISHEWGKDRIIITASIAYRGRNYLSFVTIALSILLRFTAFHNPFCMFKLFLKRLFLINSCKSDLIRYFCPLLWVITGYHIRVTWRVSLMEQELISFRSTWFLPDFKWCSCCSMVSVLCSVQSTISFFWQICLFVFKK